ncbi:hypothetical protein QF91_000329 [Salmonella enterica subsp. salamae]|nr:hypothetical protein [Salmonella enterica subsp. salamae]EDH0692783.1 hypothetical protein [Salmonella enterica]EHM1749388.1 hypothetical protein [Salmonella enterica subsp. salamae serovar 40:c:e,n,x,z15]HCM1999015.1 hypothetical protein [Salmonella enterica subsp. salamae serovar [1],40:z35:e,n,x,z15]ECI4075760.1 hypothetical protein [Salmonella enterica subsp. salamae]
MTNNKVTIGTTSKQQNNVIVQKITRHVEIFLLFWVNESDPAVKMFSESAQTRMKNIKKASWFDEKVHKVHCPPIQSIQEVKTVVSAWINKYGGKDKAQVKEVGIFSHAALDGPISVYTANTPSVPDCSCQMAITGGWDNIDFNWVRKDALCVFYGCNSGHKNGFSQKISALGNFKDVSVWGQSTSTFPSFYPDKRKTTLDRASNLVWDLEPTYMVGGNENEGYLAIISLTGIDINPLNYFLNGEYKGTSHQGMFNDHRGKI